MTAWGGMFPPTSNPYHGPIIPAPQGWTCPKCGSVWAPTTPGCFTCNKDKKP